MSKLTFKARLGRAIAVAFIILIITIQPAIPPSHDAYAQGSNRIPLKWLLITDEPWYGDSAGHTQFWVNFLRNQGVPFDLKHESTLSNSTFWDSTSQSIKYQAFIYGGKSFVPNQIKLPNSSLNAIKQAIKNGTNGILVGAALQGLTDLFGIESIGNLPIETPITYKVVTPFKAPYSYAPEWHPDDVRGTDSTPIKQITTYNWTGIGTPYVNATWDSGWAIQAIRRTYGQGVVWWWSGTQGRYGFFQNGYMEAFYSQSTIYEKWYPIVRDVLLYAFNDVWTQKVAIMPWGKRGSAITLTLDTAHIYKDLESGSNPSLLAQQGLSADLPLSVSGYAEPSAQHVELTQEEFGKGFPDYTAKGYRYFGSFSLSGALAKFMLYAKLNNITQTQADGTRTIEAGQSIEQTFTYGDNDTALAEVNVRLGSQGLATYVLQILDSTGTKFWTSGDQKAPESEGWVVFKPNITIVADSTYSIRVNTLNGTLIVPIQSGNPYDGGALKDDHSVDAAFMILARSNWDILKMDSQSDGDWSNDREVTPPLVEMANGKIYPNANGTVQFKKATNNDELKRFVVEWIGGRTDNNPKFAVFGWFSLPSDWMTPIGLQQRNRILSYKTNSELSLILSGRHHHKFQDSTVRSSDYSWNSNSSYYSFDQIVRYEQMNQIYAETVFGKGNLDNVKISSYGSSTYPPAAIYDPSRRAGAFWESGVLVAWKGQEQIQSNLGFFLGGFHSLYPTSPYDGSRITADPMLRYNFTRIHHSLSQAPTASSSQIISWYNQAVMNGFDNDYDLDSIWWVGNTRRAFDFWNGTINLLMNTTTAYYDQTNSQIVLEFNVDPSLEDFVWYFPRFKNGQVFTSLSNGEPHTIDKAVGQILHKDSSYVYALFPGEAGLHKIIVTYENGYDLNLFVTDWSGYPLNEATVMVKNVAAGFGWLNFTKLIGSDGYLNLSNLPSGTYISQVFWNGIKVGEDMLNIGPSPQKVNLKTHVWDLTINATDSSGKTLKSTASLHIVLPNGTSVDTNFNPATIKVTNGTFSFSVKWENSWVFGGKSIALEPSSPIVNLRTNVYSNYSLVFTSDDGSVPFKPTSVILTAPNGTSVVLTSDTIPKLQNGTWLIKSVTYWDSNIMPEKNLTFHPDDDEHLTLATKIFRIQPRFFDVDGNPLTLSHFTLVLPNGTTTAALTSFCSCLITNGTTQWNSILWNNLSLDIPQAFDASEGSPSVKTRLKRWRFPGFLGWIGTDRPIVLIDVKEETQYNLIFNAVGGAGTYKFVIEVPQNATSLRLNDELITSWTYDPQLKVLRIDAPFLGRFIINFFEREAPKETETSAVSSTDNLWSTLQAQLLQSTQILQLVIGSIAITATFIFVRRLWRRNEKKPSVSDL